MGKKNKNSVFLSGQNKAQIFDWLKKQQHKMRVELEMCDQVCSPTKHYFCREEWETFQQINLKTL